MNKELIDHVWKHCLPKEFKEEVKKEYNRCGCYATEVLVRLFGIDNLTSDAEGEEMLTVSREKIQEVYRQNKEEINRENVSSSDKDCYETVNEVLKTLFGSKCLPDEVTKEPKPAEPKFKVGDKVNFSISADEDLDGKIFMINPLEPTYIVVTEDGKGCTVFEHDLEPYTEPTSTFTDGYQSQRKSQSATDCHHFDNILNAGFRDHNRLHIAAMAMQGILGNEKATQYAINNFRCSDGTLNRYWGVAECSLAYADALIKEAEK